MLQKLRIENYAIIEALQIDFARGLNVITGETGAGKSILAGALDLVLGRRADTAVLMNKDKKCIVEAQFSVQLSESLQTFFSENDLDAEAELLVRREIAPSGKTRSFVNDTPVSVAQLKELGNFLVDMHRQFETGELAGESFQREVLDALADNTVLLSELREHFAAYSREKKTAETLRDQQAAAEREADYNQFLLEELQAANISASDPEGAEAELKLLSNAEQVKLQLQQVYAGLHDGETPITSTLKSLAQRLQSVLEFHPSLGELQARITAAQIELKDVAEELEHLEAGVALDPAKIAALDERLGLLYKLFKKHGVSSGTELMRILDELEQKQSLLLNISDEIAAAQRRCDAFLAQAVSAAEKIHARRKKVMPGFVKKVNELLAEVGMPNAQLQISFEATELKENGADRIAFLFDANRSGRFEPLHKVASGGELSRLMLCVKSLVAAKLEMPVLIFDEIDTGISGEAARRVGIIMKELSRAHQVISITHQPQIAAKADAHYFVYKQGMESGVKTSIRLLDGEQRILAIAQMLSGEKPGAAAISNARELMN